MHNTETIPIACELPVEEQKRCADLYRSDLFAHVDDVRERAGGYSLRFSWNPDRIRALGEFVALDSSCCSFLDHSIDVPRGKQSIWLHITGPDEARDVLRKEIDLLLPGDLKLPAAGKVTRASRASGRTLRLSGVGLVAVLCCIAPAVSVAALATAGVWVADSWPALGLMVGIGLLVCVCSSRQGRQKAACCS